jgi:hypothetical protein
MKMRFATRSIAKAISGQGGFRSANAGNPACVCAAGLSRRGFLALGATALAAAPRLAHGAADACQASGFAGDAVLTINVVPQIKTPSFDFNSSAAALRRLSAEARQIRNYVGDHGAQTVGLTICTFSTKFAVTVRSARASGRSCLALTKIDVTIEQTEHTILVAADATKPGSCERNLVIDHETRHARANDATVHDAVARTRSVLAALRPRLGPVFDRDLDANQAADLYGERLRARIDPAVDAAYEAGRLRNAAMDTPEAYASDWQRC